MSTALSWRAQGVATRLLRELLDDARRRGLRRIVLETSAGWNDPRSLYERNGFTLDREEEGEYGRDADYRLDLDDSASVRRVSAASCLQRGQPGLEGRHPLPQPGQFALDRFRLEPRSRPEAVLQPGGEVPALPRSTASSRRPRNDRSVLSRFVTESYQPAAVRRGSCRYPVTASRSAVRAAGAPAGPDQPSGQ